MAALLGLVGFHYLAAQVVATGAVFFLGFLVNRAWTF
jgi:putative flippase GtrA